MPSVRVPSPTGSVDIHYEDLGPAHGEPLLLVMGLSAQLIWWPDPFCEQLAQRGFRVIRFDNRDVGASSRLRHLGQPSVAKALLKTAIGLPLQAPYTTSDMARDALAVLDDLGIDQAHVCGASLGGIVGQRLAIEHRRRVKTLTLIMTWTGSRFGAIPQPHALRTLLSQPPRSRDEAAARTVALFRVLAGRGMEVDEAYCRDLGARSFDRSPEPGALDRQFVAMLANGSNAPALRTLDVPSLVIHGARDPLVPAWGGRQLAKVIPRSRFVLFDEMGHNLPHTLWPTVATLMADLAALPQRVG